jgi:hypothetical protein
MWGCVEAEETFNPKVGLAKSDFSAVVLLQLLLNFNMFIFNFPALFCSHFLYLFLLFLAAHSCDLPFSMKLISGCLVPPMDISYYFSITGSL